VAKLVARLLATAALWVRIKTSLINTYKMGEISKSPLKSIHIKYFYRIRIFGFVTQKPAVKYRMTVPQQILNLLSC